MTQARRQSAPSSRRLRRSTRAGLRRGRASRRARHAPSRQRARAAVVEVDSLGIGDARGRRPQTEAPQRRHSVRVRRCGRRQVADADEIDDLAVRRAGRQIDRGARLVSRRAVRRSRSRRCPAPRRDRGSHAARSRREDARRMPGHVPMLALALGQLRRLAGNSIRDEHVRRRVDCSRCRRCGSAAA